MEMNLAQFAQSMGISLINGDTMEVIVPPSTDYKRNPLIDMGIFPVTDTWDVFTELEGVGNGMEVIESHVSKRSKEYSDDYKKFTELAMVCNLKSWEVYEKNGDPELGQFYSDKYYELFDKFYEIFGENKEACDYFFEMTD